MAIKKLIFSTLLLSTLVLGACGKENGKVYPKGMDPNNPQPPAPAPKPTPEAKNATPFLAVPVSTALFSLSRIVDIALNKENAESLKYSSNCQKITTAGNTVIAKTSCGRGGSDYGWFGTEKIEVTPGADGLFSELNTNRDNTQITLNDKNYVHDFESTINITKTSHSRPGENITFNFSQHFYLNSNNKLALVEERDNDRDNGRDNDRDNNHDRENDRPRRTPRRGITYHIEPTVTLVGKIEINKTTKTVVSIVLSEVTVEGTKITTTSSGARIEAQVYLKLDPKSAEFSESKCGRIAADFSFSQDTTVDRGGGRVDPKREFSGTLQMSPNQITVAGVQSARLANCSPAFAAPNFDLDNFAAYAFKLLE